MSIDGAGGWPMGTSGRCVFYMIVYFLCIVYNQSISARTEKKRPSQAIASRVPENQRILNHQDACSQLRSRFDTWPWVRVFPLVFRIAIDL
jgi:hypothetical protein